MRTSSQAVSETVSRAWVVVCLLAISLAADAAEQRVSLDAAQQARQEHVTAFFEKELSVPTPIYRGWARLYLNRDVREGNADIRAAYAEILARVGNGAEELTPRIAGDEAVKWQLRNWVRIYFSFCDRSHVMPGRLEPETQHLIENLFWNYVCDRSYFERARSRLATDVHQSENHEMMHYSNALLALQALKDLPAYRDRLLPDGRAVAEHYEEWNAYYKHHCLVRARYGDQLELFSTTYWKYTMPELLNMHDLGEDPLLRHRVGMLLDVLWTDWALGQLNGARGGCKRRVYQEQARPDLGELRRGSHDPWYRQSLFLLDRDSWWDCNPWWHADPIRGDARVLAVTGYRFPRLVEDLITDAAGRGEYVFVARRLSRQRSMAAKDVPVNDAHWYAFDVEDSRALSYEFCTPDVVIGAFIVDPTVPVTDSARYLAGRDLTPGYTTLTSQNQYQCIQFATGRDARVVPQCLGLEKPDNYKTYNQQQAVQHKNILIVQRNPNGRGGTGPLRIYFAPGMKNRLVEQDAWLFLQEGNAYLAVKAFPRAGGARVVEYVWDNDLWLRFRDGDAPVAFIVGRTCRFATLDDFVAYVKDFSATYEGAALTLHGRDSDDVEKSLTLYTDLSRIPQVDHRPVDLNPSKLFDSPFLSSVYGTGIVTIQKGSEQLTLDFTATIVPTAATR
jgi:hypothetical protein